jgi:hypothetical protein
MSFFFFFSKTENRKAKQVLTGGWHQWDRENIRKGYRRVSSSMKMEK